MKKKILTIISLLFAASVIGTCFIMQAGNAGNEGTALPAGEATESAEKAENTNSTRKLYDELGLSGLCSYEAFSQAIVGYNSIGNRNKDVLAVIDFTQPSDKERLFVIDLSLKKLLFHTHVAHGRNSGEKYAKSFSNKPGSYQSSLGFYLTDKTYIGANGYSLLLNGIEKGINDKARDRAIVIHGASYADPGFIKAQGRLGRSLGCPALPTSVATPIIDTIKDGALIFIYADDPGYKQKSSIIN